MDKNIPNEHETFSKQMCLPLIKGHVLFYLQDRLRISTLKVLEEFRYLIDRFNYIEKLNKGNGKQRFFYKLLLVLRSLKELFSTCRGVGLGTHSAQAEHFTQLTKNKMQMFPITCDALTDAVRDCIPIVNMEVSQQFFEAAKLSESLKINNTLATLHLSSNKIVDGALALCGMLKVNYAISKNFEEIQKPPEPLHVYNCVHVCEQPEIPNNNPIHHQNEESSSRNEAESCSGSDIESRTPKLPQRAALILQVYNINQKLLMLDQKQQDLFWLQKEKELSDKLSEKCIAKQVEIVNGIKVLLERKQVVIRMLNFCDRTQMMEC